MQTRVMVRSSDSGVHIGTMVSREFRDVTLRDARRIWRWYGANTLNEVAVQGIDSGKSRVSESISEILLLEVCEIMPVTDTAWSSIQAATWGE